MDNEDILPEGPAVVKEGEETLSHSPDPPI